MQSKIVFTTVSVSFFEMCGTRTDTRSIRSLFVIPKVPHPRLRLLA